MHIDYDTTRLSCLQLQKYVTTNANTGVASYAALPGSRDPPRAHPRQLPTIYLFYFTSKLYRVSLQLLSQITLMIFRTVVIKIRSFSLVLKDIIRVSGFL